MAMFRKLLIVLHRYLGIALSLIFVMWFVTGIAMIYAKAMPTLTPESRLEHLPVLDFHRIQLRPSEAAERGQVSGSPPRVALLTIMGRPAYRFSFPEIVTVFADTGEVMNPPGPAESLTIASHFLNLPESALHHVRVLESPDQWTIGSNSLMPMHKISADDDAHTELYVSEQSGEVSVVTTRASRALAWVSAIPHWLYLSALRTNGRVWNLVVLWVSGLGTVLALMGIVLAIIQYSRKPPHIPYAGWMRWHYITGAIFGVFTLTWVFSGFLSMEPWDWASAGGLGDGMRAAFSGGPLDLKQFSAMPSTFPVDDVKEMEFVRIQGDGYYAAKGKSPTPVLVSAKSLSLRTGLFSTESLVGKARQANPDVSIAEVAELSDYDSYYYSRDRDAPLPVVRLKFDDPDKTWFYIDPRMGRILARYQKRERLQRWIYHGLHSLDFSFWYYSRPAWDIGVIALCSGGAALSAIGVWISIRRLRRDVRRVVSRL
jgi:PepSY-associated transmembrane protein